MTKISAFALASIIGLAAFPAAAEKVGNVGAVNVSAHGTPPGSGKHPLSVGLGVEKRERIDTSADGSAQIVFNDTSTMTVGRNSSVVIDDFVYHVGGGSQGVSMAKGVMRFVGGGVSHGSGASVKTPTASIGVRGGAAMVRVGGECGTLVVHQYGKIDVTGGGNTQTLMRSGYGVCAPSGGPVSEPFRVPPETIAAMTAQMASRGGQHGGAKTIPNNEEANLSLGNDRPPSINPPPGLDALNPFWAGGALVQSQANAVNQPAPPVVEEHHEGGDPPYDGWGGYP
ncbi:FecR domain-containing protein [Methylocystis sp. ATCC 49242]|uniref:FecR family protein n=1 Tax=Methylocystis sp. ATCC 49242 TaxID=622637 RepID=UPI0001F88460|nr:FecR domain-containing protein [Methylocystis sp. ATCC 49242]